MTNTIAPEMAKYLIQQRAYIEEEAEATRHGPNHYYALDDAVEILIGERIERGILTPAEAEIVRTLGGPHSDDGQCHPACWAVALDELEASRCKYRVADGDRFTVYGTRCTSCGRPVGEHEGGEVVGWRKRPDGITEGWVRHSDGTRHAEFDPCAQCDYDDYEPAELSGEELRKLRQQPKVYDPDSNVWVRPTVLGRNDEELGR